LDYLSNFAIWIQKGIATFYGASILGGLLIFVAEWLTRRKEPSDADVKSAALRYRQHYGGWALDVIGDHILAASFAPDRRHKRFLLRVSDEIVAAMATDEDRAHSIEP